MLWYLFFTFLGVTFVGFGGANGILPILYEQLVELTSLLSKEEFIELVGISQLTPGPILVNAATYAGLKLLALKGAVVTTLAVSLPSFILLSLSMALKHHKPQVFYIIKEGFRPLALSLLFIGIYILCENVLFYQDKGFSYKSLFLIASSFFLVGYWRVPSFYIFSLLGLLSVGLDWCI